MSLSLVSTLHLRFVAGLTCSRTSVAWRFQRHALASLLLCVLICRPTFAQSSNGDRERLPDGCVVIEIYGRRLAFPPDIPRSQFVFQPGRGHEPLSEVIADRAEMERWWTGAHNEH